jgi:hypothetical protein
MRHPVTCNIQHALLSACFLPDQLLYIAANFSSSCCLRAATRIDRSLVILERCIVPGAQNTPHHPCKADNKASKTAPSLRGGKGGRSAHMAHSVRGTRTQTGGWLSGCEVGGCDVSGVGCGRGFEWG